MYQFVGAHPAVTRTITAVAALAVVTGCSSGNPPSASSTAVSAASSAPSTAATTSTKPTTETNAAMSTHASQTLSVSPAGAGAPDFLDRLAESVQAVVDETGPPSAIVIVRSGKFGDATITYGARELGGTEPVSLQDQIRIGSVTKTMTATVILQLVQEGLLALDDPVSAYASDVPNGDIITIAQLLEMRSGIYNYTDDPEWQHANESDPYRTWKPEELLAYGYAHPATFPPGSNWQYSNTNYVLLGMIMEKLTGQTVEDLFSQRIFVPLGMRYTYMPIATDDSMPAPFIHGYHFGSFDKPLPPDEQEQVKAGTLLPEDVSEINVSWGWTAGSVISTPDDLLLWIDALVDGTLLDETMQQQRTASIADLGPDFPQAAGIYQYGYGIDRRWTYDGHGGQINGYNSAVARDPATDTDIVVLASLTLAPNGDSVANKLLIATMQALPNGDTITGHPTPADDEGP